MYLIDLHYHNFFIAVPSRSIPARVTIMGSIMLRVRLKDAPQKPPKSYFCTDLR